MSEKFKLWYGAQVSPATDPEQVGQVEAVLGDWVWVRFGDELETWAISSLRLNPPADTTARTDEVEAAVQEGEDACGRVMTSNPRWPTRAAWAVLGACAVGLLVLADYGEHARAVAARAVAFNHGKDVGGLLGECEAITKIATANPDSAWAHAPAVQRALLECPAYVIRLNRVKESDYHG